MPPIKQSLSEPQLSSSKNKSLDNDDLLNTGDFSSAELVIKDISEAVVPSKEEAKTSEVVVNKEIPPKAAKENVEVFLEST